MAHDFRLYGGLLSALPSLSNREPGYVTDQPRFYVGNTGLGNTLLAVLNKINATAAPTVNDDAGDGYSVGSLWVDTTNDKTYQCTDDTVGAAVWKQTGGTGSGTTYSAGTMLSLSGTTFNADINGLTADDIALADLLPFYDSSGGDTNKITVERLLGFTENSPGFRLTLTNGTPLTTADVTGATHVYLNEYTHQRFKLYDGTRWVEYTLSSAVDSGAVTLSAATLYYAYLYDNSGTLTLDLSTTAYTTQDGIRVKSGATSRLFVGWIYPSAANTMEDSDAKRFVINWYNPEPRRIAYYDSTDHNYTAGGYRQWNGSSAAKAEFIAGHQAAIPVFFGFNGGDPALTVGLDSTSAAYVGEIICYAAFAGPAPQTVLGQGIVIAAQATGYHYIALLETGNPGNYSFGGWFYGFIWG